MRIVTQSRGSKARARARRARVRATGLERAEG